MKLIDKPNIEKFIKKSLKWDDYSDEDIEIYWCVRVYHTKVLFDPSICYGRTIPYKNPTLCYERSSHYEDPYEYIWHKDKIKSFKIIGDYAYYNSLDTSLNKIT